MDTNRLCNPPQLQNFKLKIENISIPLVLHQAVILPFQRSLLFCELYDLSVDEQPLPITHSIHVPFRDVGPIRLFTQVF
jgi:hypothetical protein